MRNQSNVQINKMNITIVIEIIVDFPPIAFLLRFQLPELYLFIQEIFRYRIISDIKEI